MSLLRNLTYLGSGLAILCSFPLSSYARQIIQGNCNVQISNTNYSIIIVHNVICQASSSPSPSPSPINPGYQEQKVASVIENGGWWANYYRGKFGEVVDSDELPNQLRNGNRLGVEWGKRRPVSLPSGWGVTFSMEIFGARHFEAGTYCFTIGKRSNFTRLYLNDSLIVSKWYPEPGGYSRRCLTLNEGIYNIKVEYWSTGGHAVLDLSWQRQGNLTVRQEDAIKLPSNLPTNQVSQERQMAYVMENGGWWANYYRNQFGEFVGSGELPNQINHSNRLGRDWGGYNGQGRPIMFPQGRGVAFSMEVFGVRHFEAGQYCFAIGNKNNRGDFTKVYINDTLILSKWYPEPGGYPEGCFNLKEGRYKIKVEYWCTAGRAVLDVFWQRRGNLTLRLEDAIKPILPHSLI